MSLIHLKSGCLLIGYLYAEPLGGESKEVNHFRAISQIVIALWVSWM